MEEEENDYEFSALSKLVNDEKILHEIFSMYLKTIPNTVAGIKKDFENKEWVAAKIKIHQIRPFFIYAFELELIETLDRWRDLKDDSLADLNYLVDLSRLERKTARIITKLNVRVSLYDKGFIN